MIEIQLETGDSFNELEKLKNTLTRYQIATAVRRGINLALKKGRTQMQRDVREEYNVKQNRLLDKSPSRGLAIQGSKGTDLQGSITAGHQPVGMAAFGNIYQNKSGISIQIRKGQKEQIYAAFLLPGKGKVVFAHGKYTTNGFIFSHGATFGKARLDALNSPSVATMVLHKKTQRRYEKIVLDEYHTEVIRQFDLATSTFYKNGFN